MLRDIPLSGALHGLPRRCPPPESGRPTNDFSGPHEYPRGPISAQKSKPDRSVAKESLTTREQDVLQFLALGLSNKEIAERLLLSRRTVEWHIEHVLGKLNAPTRARALIEAARAGLLDRVSGAAHSSDARTNNLPPPLTMLFARENDPAEMRALVVGGEVAASRRCANGTHR
jgi:DNA-binding CsgD family transcriptional regulator